jgi:sigma-E factor negative regulatory protein RseA
MSIGSESDPSALENLSALSDGELDATATAHACSAWCDDAATRSTWHAYQVIGDVLRSDDLASTGRRDAAFLSALRQRLAVEPVVLAPDVASEPAVQQPTVRQVANAGRGSRWSWMAPSAVAAGFVLVAGALVVTRGPMLPGSAAPTTSRVGGPGGPAPQVVSAPTLAPPDAAFEPQVLVTNGRVLRDRSLERYLAAHQQFAGTTALGVPSGFLRNAAAEVPTR